MRKVFNTLANHYLSENHEVGSYLPLKTYNLEPLPQFGNCLMLLTLSPVNRTNVVFAGGVP